MKRTRFLALFVLVIALGLLAACVPPAAPAPAPRPGCSGRSGSLPRNPRLQGGVRQPPDRRHGALRAEPEEGHRAGGGADQRRRRHRRGAGRSDLRGRPPPGGRCADGLHQAGGDGQGAGGDGFGVQHGEPEHLPQGAGNEGGAGLQRFNGAGAEGVRQVLLLDDGLRRRPGRGMGQGRQTPGGERSGRDVHQQRLRQRRQGHLRQGVRGGRRQDADRAAVRGGRQGLPHRGAQGQGRPTPRSSSSSTTWPRAASSSSRPRNWA